VTSKRKLKKEVEELVATTRSEDRGLRQEIPYDSVREWAEFSGHNMEWVDELEGAE